MSINAHLPHKLAKLANNINSKLIHISTDCVFSGNKKSPYVETDEKDGISTYAKTKSLGEIYSKIQRKKDKNYIEKEWERLKP